MSTTWAAYSSEPGGRENGRYGLADRACDRFFGWAGHTAHDAQQRQVQRGLYRLPARQRMQPEKQQASEQRRPEIKAGESSRQQTPASAAYFVIGMGTAIPPPRLCRATPLYTRGAVVPPAPWPPLARGAVGKADWGMHRQKAPAGWLG